MVKLAVALILVGGVQVREEIRKKLCSELIGSGKPFVTCILY